MACAVAVVVTSAAIPTFAVEVGEGHQSVRGFDSGADLAVKPFYEEKTLAEGGNDGFNCYRIPSLGVAPNGNVLASWDGRPDNCADAPQPNSVVQRISGDSGLSWGDQQTVAAGDPIVPQGFSDPSVVVDWVTGRVFNFHVKSFDQGLGGSRPGTAPDDRSVLHAAYARSEDDGVTWSADNVITAEVTGDNPWRSRFATSGNGIQLQYGPHAGRLVQPAMVVTESGSYEAVAWLSDDYGETWYAGTPWGVSMDENKIVELSDGTLMNNSRSSAGNETYRKISYSRDGGVTWSEPTLDHSLPDPRNNASIIRAFPNAPEGSAKAKVLLFSNTASTTAREAGTVRMSCDDGQTWPVAKEFRPNDVQYTSMATLPDGSVGLLFEGSNRGNSNSIHFARFNLPWLGASCLGSEVESPIVRPGETISVSALLTNPFDDDIVDRKLEIDLPAGWVTETSSVTIPAGSSVPVEFTVTAPENVSTGQVDGLLRIEDYGLFKQGHFRVHVVDGVESSEKQVTIDPSVLNAADVKKAGDVIRYNFRATNPFDHPIGIIPDGELEFFDPDNAPQNCRWKTFPANSVQNCGYARHTVTAEDIERGYYQPTVTWRIGPENDAVTVHRTFEQVLPKVDLREGITKVGAELSILPVAPLESNGSTLEKDIVVQVALPEGQDEIPDGTNVALYLDLVKKAEVPVSPEGLAVIPVSVDSVAINGESVDHRLRARLTSGKESGHVLVGPDATGVLRVLPQGRNNVQRTLTVGEQADLISNGTPRSIQLVALVSGPEGPVSGVPVTFRVANKDLDPVLTDKDGYAFARYVVEPLPAGASPVTVIVNAEIPETSDETTDYPGVQNTTSFTVSAGEEKPVGSSEFYAGSSVGSSVHDGVFDLGSVFRWGFRMSTVLVGLNSALAWLHDLPIVKWWNELTGSRNH
ncbi:exo-alpha-sialidase [Corynebacterium sp. CCM 9203]